MFNLFVASCLSASVLGQNFDAKNAKILKEQRFDAGDGRFGTAFAQEDGTVFREETSADGERVGQYSYIDQDGQTITVRYTAPVQPVAVPQTVDYDYDYEPVDPSFNPFINPHDPTHRDFRFNTNGANFAPQSAPAQQNAVPPCADCAGVNP